jgi:hypothetical protein
MCALGITALSAGLITILMIMSAGLVMTVIRMLLALDSGKEI